MHLVGFSQAWDSWDCSTKYSREIAEKLALALVSLISFWHGAGSLELLLISSFFIDLVLPSLADLYMA
jgi:hypothetical protein